MRGNGVPRRVAGFENGVDLAERELAVGRERPGRLVPLEHVGVPLHRDALRKQTAPTQGHQRGLDATHEESVLEGQTHVARPEEVVHDERILDQLVV